MRTVRQQLSDSLGGEWAFDGINCWEDGKRFVRRIRDYQNNHNVYMYYKTEETKPITLTIWR